MMRKNWKCVWLGLALAVLVLALAGCGGRDTSKEAPAQEEPAGETEQTPEQGVTILEDTDTAEIGDDTIPVPGQDLVMGSGTADPAVEPEGGNQPAKLEEEPELQLVEEPGNSSSDAGSAQTPAEPPALEEPQSSGSAAADTAEQPVSGTLPEGSVDLAAFYETLASDANWPSMIEMDREIQDNFYAGLSDISTRQCHVYMTMISAVAGELALVEVENSADTAAVEAIFQARIDSQVGDEENPGGAWYPSTIESWKDNSRIVTEGNYVMLVVAENADSVADAFRALFA